MRRAALTITFAAAVAAMALAPSWAVGAPGTLTDQNFAAGTFANDRDHHAGLRFG